MSPDTLMYQGFVLVFLDKALTFVGISYLGAEEANPFQVPMFERFGPAVACTAAFLLSITMLLYASTMETQWREQFGYSLLALYNGIYLGVVLWNIGICAKYAGFI